MLKFMRPGRAAALCLSIAAFAALGEAQAVCTITGAQNIDFGHISGMSSNPQNVSGQVNFSCNAGIYESKIRHYCVTITESHNGVGSRLAIYQGGTDRGKSPPANTYMLFRLMTDQGDWGGSTKGTAGIAGTVGYTGQTDTGGDFTVPFTAVLDAPVTVQPGTYSSSNFTIRVADDSYSTTVKPSDLCVETIHLPSSSQYKYYSGFKVQATVMPGCMMETTPIAFGSQMSLAAQHTATGSVTVHCSAGTSYSLTLDAGQNADSDGTNRMKCSQGGCAGNYISYLLYADSSATTVWNNVKNPGFVQKGTIGTGAGSANYPVIGKTLAPQPTPPAGPYRDTVAAILTVTAGGS